MVYNLEYGPVDIIDKEADSEKEKQEEIPENRGWESKLNPKLTEAMRNQTEKEFWGANCQATEVLFDLISRVAQAERYSDQEMIIEKWGKESGNSEAKITKILNGFKADSDSRLYYHYDELDGPNGRYGTKIKLNQEGLNPEEIHQILFLNQKLSDGLENFLANVGDLKTVEMINIMKQKSRLEGYVRGIRMIEARQHSDFGDWQEDVKNLKAKLAEAGVNVDDFGTEGFNEFQSFKKEDKDPSASAAKLQ